MSIEVSQADVPKTHPQQLEEAKTLTPDLSPEHQAFLADRHGTIDLDPIPSIDPADPYNWPAWKKGTNLALVAFHAFMGTFSAAGIIPAFQQIAEELGVSLQRASYLVSLQIAILGGAPLFWKPLSHRFGRRPIFLLSLILSCVSNVGCAKSPDYASMAACRALVACFISPAMAIGSAVVMETYFQHERARYMGIWTVMVTLGVPIGPLIFGFVANRVGYVWIYWILAIVSVSVSTRAIGGILTSIDKWMPVYPVHLLRTRNPLHRVEQNRISLPTTVPAFRTNRPPSLHGKRIHPSSFPLPKHPRPCGRGRIWNGIPLRQRDELGRSTPVTAAQVRAQCRAARSAVPGSDYWITARRTARRHHVGSLDELARASHRPHASPRVPAMAELHWLSAVYGGYDYFPGLY